MKGAKSMKTAASIIIILAAIFFFVPMIVGRSADLCQAAERHNVSNAAASVAGGKSGPVYGAINTVGQSMATGNAEAEKQSEQRPGTPTPISCATAFWTSL